jgi:sigma-54 specific flagellar transcriptional regulator A
MATVVAENAESLLIGESPAMVEVRRLVRQVAPSTASVLVTGPSGSGKEMVARAIHAESGRATKSLVAVNCGAITRDLLESELFGHEKGAFTGAINLRRGRFEEAHEGTLFLDEIGDMPTDMQVKLLRVLEEGTVQRVGGHGEIAVDNRIIAATHRDLGASISVQRFREDLYYRLAVFPIHLPSLAERPEDVPLILRHFLHRKSDVRFTSAAMNRLAEHSWDGNVRELRNVAQRAAILFPSKIVGVEEVEMLLHRPGRPAPAAPAVSGARAMQEKLAAALDAGLLGQNAPAATATATAAPASEDILADGPVDLRSIVADIECRYINEALKLAGGVVAEAARSLSLQRTTLIEKMRKHGLDRIAA